jgi:predicted permease
MNFDPAWQQRLQRNRLSLSVSGAALVLALMILGGTWRVFLDVVLPVFALVAIGYFAGPRLGLEAKTLSRYAYFILIPAFIFNVISSADLPLELTLTMVSYSVITHLAVAAAAVGVGVALKRSKEVIAAFVLIAVFGNVGNFGLSLIEFRFGDVSRVPATVYFLAILVTSFVVSVGVSGWVKHGSVRAVWEVLKTPALLALPPAALFAATDLEVPLSVNRLTGLLGQAMVPTMIVTLGVQLAAVKKIALRRDLWLACGLRLLLAPLLALLLAGFFPLQGMERDIGILQAAMPVAILSSIIAIEYDVEPDFVTTSVLLSTLLGIVTLTILLSVI